MKTNVAFESSSVAMYPTNDGRSLCLGDGIVRGTIDIRFEHRHATDELPTDVAACDLWLADSEGRMWKTTSRFTAEVFMRHLNDLSRIDGSCFSMGKAPEHFSNAIGDNRVLDDIRFSSDDRFYRKFIIDGDIFETNFSYTTVHFDVGLAPDESEDFPIMTSLAIRVRKDSLVAIRNQNGESGTNADFGFYMNWRYLLLSHTAVYFPEYGRWRDVAIPMPLLFSGTDGSAGPQPNVKVQ